MIRRAPVLLFALFSGACSLVRESPPAPSSVGMQVEALKLRLFILVEEQRHKLNAEARPLALDPELSSAAQVHSDDMAKKRSFDVMNPNGNPAVNTLLADPKFRGFVAENSAAQYFTPAAGINPDMVAQGFLDIWLNSPSHKSNLSFARFDRTGIGIAVSGNMIYAAEVFATDLGLPEP
jgi:uncharacterized protein YkwD